VPIARITPISRVRSNTFILIAPINPNPPTRAKNHCKLVITDLKAMIVISKFLFVLQITNGGEQDQKHESAWKLIDALMKLAEYTFNLLTC
jgi:hypothetical protein